MLHAETLPSSLSRRPGKGVIRHTENIVVSMALGAMVLIPTTEIVLRATFSTGIGGLTAIAQHMTLIVSMLGAAIATRDDRLLSVSTTSLLLNDRTAENVRWFTRSVAATVTGCLCLSAIRFVMAEHEGGNELAFGLPLWTVQLILPIGFALITMRLICQSSTDWRWRAGSVLIAAIGVGAMATLPAVSQSTVVACLAILLIATTLGSPIFVVLGGAALILFWGQETPIAAVALNHYGLMVNPSLPAIPLFTLAGYFLAEGGAPKRLIEVFQALFGQLRTGAVFVTVLVCVFFTCFTGASGVTILALGGLLMPLLLSARCSDASALGLVTGGGLPGVLLAPSLPLILYAIVAQVPLEQMFLGGILPAMVMTGLILWWGSRHSEGPAGKARKLDWRRARAALGAAKWELLLPVVAFVALFGGIATPVEAAALTALYAFFVEVFVYRDLRLTIDIPRIMAECSLLVGGVLIILGVALGFTNFLIDAEIPGRLVDWVTSSLESRWTFLLALNLFLLLVGCLMDIFTAIVILAPLIVPIGVAFGVNPIHLGIIFLANLELGYLTPPVGMNLFFASYRFDRPVTEVYRSVIPLFFVLSLGVLVITYLPALSTALPAFWK